MELRNFSVHLEGFPCTVLICTEIHRSYVESIHVSQRRVCLVPKYIVDELFSGLSSPALIKINSTCDIMVRILFYLSFNPHHFIFYKLDQKCVH